MERIIWTFPIHNDRVGRAFLDAEVRQINSRGCEAHHPPPQRESLPPLSLKVLPTRVVESFCCAERTMCGTRAGRKCGSFGLRCVHKLSHLSSKMRMAQVILREFAAHGLDAPPCITH